MMRGVARSRLIWRQNLAYAEMRSIMARMLWNFDMELCDDSKDWARQKVFVLWDKPALNVRLKVRKGLPREGK